MCEICSAEQQTQCFGRCMVDDLRAMLEDQEENLEDVLAEMIEKCLDQ